MLKAFSIPSRMTAFFDSRFLLMGGIGKQTGVSPVFPKCFLCVLCPLESNQILCILGTSIGLPLNEFFQFSKEK